MSSEIHSYAITVSFISLLIIICIVILLQEQDKTLSPEDIMNLSEENQDNMTARPPNLIARMRCLNCMQYSDIEENQRCMNLCLKYS